MNITISANSQSICIQPSSWAYAGCGLIPNTYPFDKLYKKYGAKVYLFCAVLSHKMDSDINIDWLHKTTMLK